MDNMSFVTYLNSFYVYEQMLLLKSHSRARYSLQQMEEEVILDNCRLRDQVLSLATYMHIF